MNIFLTTGAVLSAIAAMLHVGCIYFGAPWYRLFGAGEGMATLAEQGSIQPTLITTAIVVVLSTWSLYAFSGAGIIFKLPFTKWVLAIITLIYLFRGIAGFFLIGNPLGRNPEFWLWSSLICLCLGIIHLLGLKQIW